MTESSDKGEDTQKKTYQHLDYFRYTSDRGSGTRGVVGLLDSEDEEVLREIPAYPHINRVYRFNKGIKHFFGDSDFYAEEKLDGYNARLFKYKERLLALSRGGIICPFTTEWAGHWNETYHLDEFFAAMPDYVLCGEITGDNPYNSQHDPGLSPGAHLHIFDILKPGGGFLPPMERYELVERFNLPSVPRFGRFNSADLGTLHGIILDLNERRREGLVLKSLDGNDVVKFVTPLTDLQDIEDGIIVDFDMHHRFFRNRLLRASLFIQDFGLNRDEYAKHIGNAFLQGYQALESFSEASEYYTIYVEKKETWHATRTLIRSQVSVRTDKIEETELNGKRMYKVQFRRVFKKSTHRYHNILKGFPHTD